jgi:uncharacterized protein YegP (UPF0339 family)
VSTRQPGESTLRERYRTRIGDPATEDEFCGYRLFVLGLVLGVAGVLLFLVSGPPGGVGQLSMVGVGIGLLLAFVGPVIHPRSLRQSQAGVELYEDRAGEHRWRLRHRNGQIVATGSEGDAEKSKAEDAVDRFELNPLPPESAVEEPTSGSGGDDEPDSGVA